MFILTACSLRAQHVYVGEERVGRFYRDVVDGKGSGTARLRVGRRVGGIYRDVVVGKACTQHVYVWEEEWAVVSRDDADGESHCYELTSVESSDNDKTYELL